ncbi:MAG: hypothetical protein BGN96_06180 [Bacteroidales bacterium 45-6]|nr:MAG: hypothetical protein BGN96_06180 [Bacteroidales bacterium 45-6]
MKHFLIKISLFFLIPTIGIILCSLFLPIDTLAYRPWEGLRYSKAQTDSPFYPNSFVSMNSVGDLCHHTENAVMKQEQWQTDELGFRNNKYIKNPDILIIGDSFVAGTGLTQANTLCNQLIALSGDTKVYNIAPSSMSEFDNLLQTGKLGKPKLLVFSIVERNVPENIQQHHSANSKPEKMKDFISSNALEVCMDKIAKSTLLNWIKARALRQGGNGIRSTNHSNMYFLQGAKQRHKKDDLASTTAALISYKQYCDSLGVKFLFLPIPDKETVYHELVPIVRQSDYLLQLDSLLSVRGIPSINCLKVYNDYRKTDSSLLYHLDDTHWNSRAVTIIAKEIVKQMRRQKELSGIATGRGRQQTN